MGSSVHATEASLFFTLHADAAQPGALGERG